MSNVFSRSWQITKLTINVIKKDKELLLFPLLGGIFSILFIIAMVFPTIVVNFIEGYGQGVSEIMSYIIVFLVYLGLAFIATFFNVCVVYTTKKRFEGGNATFGESLKFAFSKIHLILGWSLLSATVGLIMNIIDNLAERFGEAGRIILKLLNSIFGLVWSIVTIFVVPAMVYNNLGPIAAIKKSVQTLKKTWGESLVRYYGLGFIQFLFIFMGLILFVVFAIVVANLGIFAILTVIGLGVLYFLLVSLFFNAATTVFNTALYVYADQGKIPTGFDKQMVQNAFKKK